MKRTHAAVPLVLYTSACAVPHTPSLDFVARAEQVPPATELVLPSTRGAYAAWMLPPEDPWARYSKGTLLASLGDRPQAGALPDVRALSIVQRAERAAALLAPRLPPDALWVVDLRGAASVAFGNALSHAAPVSLVLTFNNWPAEDELVPAEETLAALLTLRPRAAEVSAGPRPVFLLDAWRLAYRDREPGDDVLDNRYFLSEADLPDAGTLAARGIRQVVYLTETLGDDPAQAVEEDDLHETFSRYGQAGIGLTLVGLDDILGERPEPVQSVGPTYYWLHPSPGGPGWWWWWRRYRPIHRATILRGPAFYSRSRGGFGGVRARPSFHSGGSFGGHGGGFGGGHGGG